LNDWRTFDWDAAYRRGEQLNRYPFDAVVSYVIRNAAPGSRILEIGCGTGNNLWFLAREGFDAAGIDSSETAIAYATKRFEEEGLTADIRLGDFHDLPWPDDSFDMVIDRAALQCSTTQPDALREIARVLRPEGRFLSISV
jgi:ubiquinone/menaquinone biosynthesis C-methylase UbiE